MRQVLIYTDGSSKGTSDGPGGYAAIVKFMNGKKVEAVREYTEGFKVTTNNRMELMGVICGLESLEEPCNVTIFSDSQYVTKAFNENWVDNWTSNNWMTSNKTPVKNVDLWKRLIEAKKPHTCQFIWVKGHAGHVENERCDYLAQASSNGIKFDRLADGTLTPKNYEEVTPTFVPSDFVDKDEINNIVKNYLDMNLPAGIDKMTVMINKIKCELTKDGKLYVSPDEDNREEKAKKVQESLEILGELVGHLVAMNASLIDFKKGADTSVEQKTTGSKTIPKFEVSNT